MTVNISVLGPLQSLPAPAADCPIHVVAARVASPRKGGATIRYVSGWGGTPETAALGCQREAAERYCAQVHGDEAIQRRRVVDLVDEAVLPPEIILIDDWQFDEREAWNLLHQGFNETPERWIGDRPIDWIAATPQLSTTTKWLPAGLCFLGHEGDRSAGLSPADSNGLAAGSSPEDAAVRAFMELAERDAVAIWWYNRVSRPQLDPQAIDAPLVSIYDRWTTAHGRPLRLHDLTHDLGLPVVAAVAHDIDGGHIAIGFGAGWSSAQAATHAVGELAQCEANLALLERNMAERGSLPNNPDARALIDWWRTATLSAHPHLGGSARRIKPRHIGPLDLQGCQTLCQVHGLGFIALDLSRNDAAPSVVRVIVPGLRPIWARFAPGRLFDVPTTLGWREQPIAVDALNPTPLMF